MLFISSVRVLISLSLILSVTYSIENQNISNCFKRIFKSIDVLSAYASKSLSICEQNETSNHSLDHIEQLRDKYNEKKFPRNCADLLKMGFTESGIRTIYPCRCCTEKSFNVFCDQKTDGGGWTVIQYRNDFPERENFNRSWEEYKLGFGNLNEEFWLGLDNIRALVSETLMELRVDLEDYEGSIQWAKYSHFYISDEINKYKLDIGDYSGDAGDGLRKHLGINFSTYDQNNDRVPKNCAKIYKGGWWYYNCHISNLNGFQHKGNNISFRADGIIWQPFRGYHYSLRKSKLSIKPSLKQ